MAGGMRSTIVVNSFYAALCWAGFLFPYLYVPLSKHMLRKQAPLFYATSGAMAVAIFVYLCLMVGALFRSTVLILVYLVLFPLVQAVILVQAAALAIVVLGARRRGGKGDAEACRKMDEKAKGAADEGDFRLSPTCEELTKYSTLFFVLAGVYILGTVVAFCFWNKVRIFRKKLIHAAKRTDRGSASDISSKAPTKRDTKMRRREKRKLKKRHPAKRRTSSESSSDPKRKKRRKKRP